MRFRPALALAGLLLPSAAPALHAQAIQASPAAIVAVFNLGYPVAVNAAGQATGGRYAAPGRVEAFFTGPGGSGVRGLGTLPGSTASGGSAVNGRGQVAGTASFGNVTSVQQAFVTGLDGQGIRGLGTLSGYNSSIARRLNASGQVVGYGLNVSPGGGSFTGSEAFITGSDGQAMRGLGFLGTGPGFQAYSRANGVNASGQVTGASTTASGQQEAFLTGPDGQGMRGLGALPGGTNTEGTAVNASGQVAGWGNSAAATAAGAYTEAFVTGPGGAEMVGLGFGNVAQTDGSFADDMDDIGRVVGRIVNASRTSVGSYRDFAFVYTPRAGLELLDDLVGGGWQITAARGISPVGGYIAALGDNPSAGLFGTGLLIRVADTPSVVPEPDTWALLGTGLLAVGGVTRRRRRAEV